MPKFLDIILKSFEIILFFPLIVLYFAYLFIRYIIFIIKKTIFFLRGNITTGNFDNDKSNQRIFYLFILILILQFILIIGAIIGIVIY